MNRFLKTLSVKAMLGTLGVLALLLLSGCIGIYDNSDLFTLNPNPSQTENELLNTYGTPAFATTVGNQKVYTYKIRDNMYIICVGIFRGKDFVVTCEDGKVKEIKQVDRPKAFSLFQPWTWSDTE